MKKFMVAWGITVVADFVGVFGTSYLITAGVMANGLIVGLVVIFAFPALESVFLIASRQFESNAMFKNMYKAQLISVVVAALFFLRSSSALELSITDLSAQFFGFILLAPPLKFFLINSVFPMFEKSESGGAGGGCK